MFKLLQLNAMQHLLRSPDGEEGGGGDPPKPLTQADIDAAVKAATKDLQRDNKALADKVAAHERAQAEKDGDKDKQIELLKGELETLKPEHERLKGIATAFEADRAERWKGVEAVLGKDDKGKTALREVFRKADTPENIAFNLDLHGKLVASGMFKAAPAAGSLDEGNGGRGRGAEDTRTPLQKLSDGFSEQGSK